MEVERDLGGKFKVKTLRSDNGTEYINREMETFCMERGILLDIIPPYTSPLNGVAERFNRSLQEKMRALIFDSGFPTGMWEYAAEVSCYNHNIAPNKSIDLETPYRKWFGNQTELRNVRRFGCLGFVKNNDPKLIIVNKR